MAVNDAMVEAAAWTIAVEEYELDEGGMAVPPSEIFGNPQYTTLANLLRGVARRALAAADAVRGGDGAPPAGTVAVRVCTAMTSVAEMPGYMEGHTFFAFSDGTIWCRGQTNGDWARVEGPPAAAPRPRLPWRRSRWEIWCG